VADEARLTTDKLTEFLQVVENWRNDWNIGDSAVYRGHTYFEWKLVAKLFRDPKSDGELRMKEAHNLERKLFHAFSRYLYAYRPDLVCSAPEEERSNARAMQEWRQLALAQHYGLPTRFLDFTTNMLVALFFAVEGPGRTINGESEEQDSAVWCIEVPYRKRIWEVWKKEGVWLSPLEFAEEGSDPPIANFVDTAYVPEHIDERIRAQGSVFMCEPRGKKPSWTLHQRLQGKNETIDLETGDKKPTRTLKVLIPSAVRESLQDQLDLVGINRATLFPDLGSAAKYLTWSIYQRKRF
jgi:hypothetical protein